MSDKTATVRGSGSVSDQRKAACVGGWRERPATRSSSSRKTPTNSLTPSPTRPAIRGPALRAARNYPTSSSYSKKPAFSSKALTSGSSGTPALFTWERRPMMVVWAQDFWTRLTSHFGSEPFGSV